jgi:hypothetical protein
MSRLLVSEVHLLISTWIIFNDTTSILLNIEKKQAGYERLVFNALFIFLRRRSCLRCWH